jgi:sugar lactone lactonase YvrE
MLALPQEEVGMTLRTLFVAALSVLVISPAAPAWNRSPAVEFAELPPPLRHPEGLTVDLVTGVFYVSDFDYQATSATGRVASFDRSGKLLRIYELANSSPALLGLGMVPGTHDVLVIDFGGHQVLRLDPVTGASPVFASIPLAAGLNALTFDKAGNVYLSDSFGGIIWKTGPAGGTATAWVTSDLLSPQTGVPPFGANGLAFDSKGTLFVANTAMDWIVKIPVADGVPGTPERFVNSINGADGLIIDGDDNLWVAANQADEIVVVDPSGKAIAKLGDFDGISPEGAPRGLLFPASPVFFGEFVYVTNLALDLRDFDVIPGRTFNAVDSQYCAEVTTWNVARISRHLPPVHDRTLKGR